MQKCYDKMVAKISSWRILQAMQPESGISSNANQCQIYLCSSIRTVRSLRSCTGAATPDPTNLILDSGQARQRNQPKLRASAAKVA